MDEKFRGHPFNVSENLEYRKISCIIGGITILLRNFFVSCAEKFRGHPFNFSEKLGYRKILCIIGGITIFRRNIFCLTAPKNFVGIPSMSQKFWGFEKFYAY